MRKKQKPITKILLLGIILVMSGGRPEALWASEAQKGQGQWSIDQVGTERYWSYTDETGKFCRSQKAVIDGKTYFFDEQGHMLCGWVSEDGEAVTEEEGLGYLEGAYYCGGPEEGWAATGWKYLEVAQEDGSLRRRWFYFKDSGKKAVSTSITEEDENGAYRYSFGEDGILRSSKKIRNASGVPTSLERTSGGQWIQKVPGPGQDLYASENQIKRWFYGLHDGTILNSGIKTIDGKKYLFDSAGIMRTGLVVVNKEKKYQETLVCAQDGTDCSPSDLEGYMKDHDLMYFDETTGARKTGAVAVTMGGEEMKMVFDQAGRAVHGPYKGYLYSAGLIQKASKDVEYDTFVVDGKEYLVSSSGKIQKND